MSDPRNKAGFSRRQFMARMAQGTVLAGAAAVAGRPVVAAEKNPFAYDVGRFSKTDPTLIAWEEVGRKTCPGKGARRIAFGPDDTLYAAAGSQIFHWAADDRVSAIDAGAMVTCLAVAADGAVVAALRDHLVVFDPAGKQRAVWEAPDRRTWISGLALGAESVFAADAGGRIILRYDWKGKIMGRIGAKNAAENIPGLVVPSPYLDVKLHADGLLRVNNPGRHRFEAYTVDGHFEAAWGAPSLAIGGFCGCCNPIGLALLPDGRTVTCEKGLPRVKVYGADGTFEAVVAGPESFVANAKAGTELADGPKGGLDAAVDGRGRIHILDRVTAAIHILQPKKGRA